MKARNRRRSILHVDLDPFIVSVERSLDSSLRGQAVVIGGDGASGIVAAASEEARATGVRPGQTLIHARRLCPNAVFRRGDFETYARVSDDVSAVLLAANRRLERPSADEAYVELTREENGDPTPVAAAEAVKDQLQRRLGLDASLGLAASRLAARVASRWARPRGLLVVLPGYEASFMARQSIALLGDLPPHLEAALLREGIETLGAIAQVDDAVLNAAVGSVAAARLRAIVRGEDDEPVPVAAPPAWIQEEVTIRAHGSDQLALIAILDGLADRAWRRLRPFRVGVGSLTVEVRRVESSLRRTDTFEDVLTGEAAITSATRTLAAPLLEPTSGVRGLQIRLGRIAPPGRQAPLFPRSPALPDAPLRRWSLR